MFLLSVSLTTSVILEDFLTLRNVILTNSMGVFLESCVLPYGVLRSHSDSLVVAVTNSFIISLCGLFAIALKSGLSLLVLRKWLFRVARQALLSCETGSFTV